MGKIKSRFVCLSFGPIPGVKVGWGGIVPCKTDSYRVTMDETPLAIGKSNLPTVDTGPVHNPVILNYFARA